MGHFPQKSPVISDYFAESDLWDKASYGSSPPCICAEFVHGLHVHVGEKKEGGGREKARERDADVTNEECKYFFF